MSQSTPVGAAAVNKYKAGLERFDEFLASQAGQDLSAASRDGAKNARQQWTRIYDLFVRYEELDEEAREKEIRECHDQLNLVLADKPLLGKLPEEMSTELVNMLKDLPPPPQRSRGGQPTVSAKDPPKAPAEPKADPPKKSTRTEDSAVAAGAKPPPKSAPKRSVLPAAAEIDAAVRRLAEKSAREDRSTDDDDSQAGVTGPAGLNPGGEEDASVRGGELAADEPARSSLKGRALPPEVARCFAQPPEVMAHYGIEEIDPELAIEVYHLIRGTGGIYYRNLKKIFGEDNDAIAACQAFLMMIFTPFKNGREPRAFREFLGKSAAAVRQFHYASVESEAMRERHNMLTSDFRVEVQALRDMVSLGAWPTPGHECWTVMVELAAILTVTDVDIGRDSKPLKFWLALGKQAQDGVMRIAPNDLKRHTSEVSRLLHESLEKEGETVNPNLIGEQVTCVRRVARPEGGQGGSGSAAAGTVPATPAIPAPASVAPTSLSQTELSPEILALIASHKSASELGGRSQAGGNRPWGGGRGRGGGQGRPRGMGQQSAVHNWPTMPGEDGSPGKRAKPLPPGETNLPMIGGPLDVRGRCWQCLKLTQHKAKDCQQPHPQYNPQKYLDAIQKLAHGLLPCP